MNIRYIFRVFTMPRNGVQYHEGLTERSGIDRWVGAIGLTGVAATQLASAPLTK